MRGKRPSWFVGAGCRAIMHPSGVYANLAMTKNPCWGETIFSADTHFITEGPNHVV